MNKMRIQLKIICLALSVFFSITTCLVAQEVVLEEAFPETFNFLLGFELSHSESSDVYVVRRNGDIRKLNSDDPSVLSISWLNISDRVLSEGEGGLLGLAFHPDYPVNESFYLYYVFKDENEQLFSTVSRFQAPGGIADPGSEERLILIEQPATNHNGGQVKFGPDGYLYVALGDGGGDITDDSQNTLNLLGSIIRIDVNFSSGYGVPDDNPFVGDDDGLDEIYAWGFRNPWRFSFDTVTGFLWVADVGEKDWESIYIVDKGKNYGWPIVEGSHCFIEDCDKTGLEMPLYEYPWGNDFGRSITGGYVYRGSANPSLFGKYIYGDFITGTIWALEINHDTREVINNSELINSELNISSFGKDRDDEIYILSWGSGAKIYNFESEPVSEPGVVSLVSPSDGSEGVSVEAVFEWLNDEYADRYQFQLSENASFATMVFDSGEIVSTILELDAELKYNSSYYWRVRGVGESGTGSWSEVWNFRTVPEQVIETVIESIFPNPFNPSTNIRYKLAGISDVRLEIYDATGRRIAVLANERQTAGTYTVPFNAEFLSSGIYLVILRTNENIQTKKFTLVK